MKIEVIGANTVTSTANVPGIGIIETSSNSIEGNGTLMVSALNDCEALFVHTVDTLTIKYCKLTAIGSDCGIYGVVAKQLIIDNATVSATGTNYGSISGFDDMELIGCAIVKPAGAVFNPDNDAVCYADGTVVKEEVKIKPTGTGVKNIGNQTVIIYPNPVQDILHIQAEGAVIAVRVYNIHGAVVAQALNNAREINLSHLPTGIYMVRVEVGENVGAMRIIKN
ncbi:MAG TPA: T9SS type A sorting domain-containing protein [Paludibacteraceae bacterium]|nr:T9SS type A sorting domain-containing protein [Paludibacteraceae bacterium]